MFTRILADGLEGRNVDIAPKVGLVIAGLK